MKFEILVDSRAEDAIAIHLAYIAIDQNAPQVASQVAQRIYDSVQTLSAFPHRCPIAPESEFSQHVIRMLIVDRCLVLYVIDDERSTVNVVGFRHGRQLPVRGLKK